MRILNHRYLLARKGKLSGISFDAITLENGVLQFEALSKLCNLFFVKSLYTDM